MPERKVLLYVLLAVAGVLAAALLWRMLSRPDASLAGLSAEEVRIERLRRAGDVAALAAEAGSGREETAVLAVRALGRLGPGAIGPLAPALKDPRERVRASAAVAFGRVATRERAAPLAEALAKDPSARVRAAAATALHEMLAYNHMEALLGALNDDSRGVRQRAFRAVAEITGVEVRYSPDASPADRLRAAEQMRRMWKRIAPIVREYHESGPARR